MKIPYLLASIVATALVSSPLAYTAQGHGAQVTKFKSYKNSVIGYSDDGQVDFSLHAYVYDDFDSGGPRGDVSVSFLDYSSSSYYSYHISCSGPAYANIVFVNRGNGNSSVKATLDPSSPDCFTYFGDPPSPLTVELVGQHDGTYRASSNGTGMDTYNGVNHKSNFQSDSFSETFTGTIGDYSVTFTGYASGEHRTDRIKVK